MRGDSVRGPFLVITPCLKLTCWAQTLKRSIPSLPVVCLNGTAAERRRVYLKQLDATNTKSAWFPPIIALYEVALWDREHLKSIGEFTCGFLYKRPSLANHRCHLLCLLNSISCKHCIYLSRGPINLDAEELLQTMNTLNSGMSSLVEHMIRAINEDLTASKAKRDDISVNLRKSLTLFIRGEEHS